MSTWFPTDVNGNYSRLTDRLRNSPCAPFDYKNGEGPLGASGPRCRAQSVPAPIDGSVTRTGPVLEAVEHAGRMVGVDAVALTAIFLLRCWLVAISGRPGFEQVVPGAAVVVGAIRRTFSRSFASAAGARVPCPPWLRCALASSIRLDRTAWRVTRFRGEANTLVAVSLAAGHRVVCAFARRPTSTDHRPLPPTSRLRLSVLPRLR